MSKRAFKPTTTIRMGAAYFDLTPMGSPKGSSVDLSPLAHPIVSGSGFTGKGRKSRWLPGTNLMVFDKEVSEVGSLLCQLHGITPKNKQSSKREHKGAAR